MRLKPFSVFCCAYSLLLPQPGVFGADDKKDKEKADAAQRETVSKPLTEKEKKRREKALKKELEGPYKQWLTVDVAYIITDEERQAFKRLNTDEEKQQFIERFGLRRAPPPDPEKTKFKKEHYRRTPTPTNGMPPVSRDGRP